MNTKDRIIIASLDLFSQKGYEAVSIREIAEAVGLQKASLYNHFKNKEDIFNSMPLYLEAHMKDSSANEHFLKLDEASILKLYKEKSKEELIELSSQSIQYYMTDEVTIKFKRMYSIEQFRNPTIREHYRNYFYDSIINRLTKVNETLIQEKIYMPGDPYIMALQYLTPIFYIMERYDNEPTQLEHALHTVKECSRAFLNQYLNQA